MGVTVTVKLNQPANFFNAGDATGVSIRGGVKYFDREEKKELYTNYEAVVFSNNQKQVEFYQNALLKGAIVEISGHNQRIKQFNGQNGLVLSIEILEAKFGLIDQSAPKKSMTQGAAQHNAPAAAQPQHQRTHSQQADSHNANGQGRYNDAPGPEFYGDDQ
jgi:single-strand DNA-binding protein